MGTKRLTWRKQPNERGLASVCQSPRGFDLRLSGERVASVLPNPVGFQRWRGWYWCCPSNGSLGIEWNNTADTPTETADEAKAQCERYIREALAAARKEEERG